MHDGTGTIEWLGGREGRSRPASGEVVAGAPREALRLSGCEDLEESQKRQAEPTRPRTDPATPVILC